MLRHGSLFSGIGGFDLAAEWMGWENVFHCEWNEFCQKVLNKHFPKSLSYGDITKTDFTIHRGNIDIITGGFPCQPYSTAGKRLGKEDARHLWPEMLRAIREIQPTYIVGENVLGFVNWNGGLVFHEVQTELENEGYEIQPVILPACAVGAPHRRERVWFVAYSNKRTARPPRKSDGIIEQGCNNNDESKERREQAKLNIRCSDVLQSNTNTDDKGLQGGEKFGIVKKSREKQNKQSSGLFQSAWDKFPTKPAICGGNDGIPDRMDRIKALGNAIVPQVSYQIFKAINEHEKAINDTL